MKNTMKTIYNINISKNKNGTSYSITCPELRIGVTMHHHNLESYLKELKKSIRISLRDCEYKAIFSSYIDFFGYKRNSFSMTNK